MGDWNGDGKTESAVYQNGVLYLDYDGNAFGMQALINGIISEQPVFNHN